MTPNKKKPTTQTRRLPINPRINRPFKRPLPAGVFYGYPPLPHREVLLCTGYAHESNLFFKIKSTGYVIDFVRESRTIGNVLWLT